MEMEDLEASSQWASHTQNLNPRTVIAMLLQFHYFIFYILIPLLQFLRFWNFPAESGIVTFCSAFTLKFSLFSIRFLRWLLIAFLICLNSFLSLTSQNPNENNYIKIWYVNLFLVICWKINQPIQQKYSKHI